MFTVDNFPAHGEVRDLISIKLEFLPANTTAILQPMNQGAIRNVQVLFCRRFLRRMMLGAHVQLNQDECLLSEAVPHQPEANYLAQPLRESQPLNETTNKWNRSPCPY